MRGRGTKRFWTVEDRKEWREVLREATDLLVNADPDERIDLALEFCITLENAGAFLKTADYALVGIQACEEVCTYDARYAALLRGLGKGYYYQQLYDKAALMYTRLYEWAVANENPGEAAMARYSIACCNEKNGPSHWSEALELYESVFNSDGATWAYKLAATVNHVRLLMKMGQTNAAYELATTRFLLIPQDEKRWTPWVEFLVLLALLLVEKGDLHSAEVVINDALDALPDNRPVTAAKVHAVYALVCHLRGNTDEAYDAVELAWAYAEMVPTPDAYQLIQEVEQKIRG